MFKYGGLVSSNAVSCGIYGGESDTKRGLSLNTPVLPSVLTTSPHLIALSFCYHRFHTILAGVTVIDTLRSYKIYRVTPLISSFFFCLCLWRIFALFCCTLNNIKPPTTLQCARVK